MTTYTTPHFATGGSDRNLHPDPANDRTRSAGAAPYRTAGVSNEAAALRTGPTPDWQPGVAKGGVPKAAIGALGAALVGGVALAIVLMAPSNKVVKQVSPDPVAQATARNAASQKAVDSSTAAVNELDKNPPAAGTAPVIVAPGTDTATTDTRTTTSTSTTKVETAPAIPAPVQAVIPHAPPVVHEQHHAKATVAAPKAAPQPVHSVPAPAPVATPPADVQAPAMQQTPDAPTVTPAPTPSPTPDTPAPTPVPAPTE